jgi:hypothetical protein
MEDATHRLAETTALSSITNAPTASPYDDNTTKKLEMAELEHVSDALTTLTLNITLILCLLLAYYVKRFRIYFLPESAMSLLVGIVVGGVARLSTDKLQLFEFVSTVYIAFHAFFFGLVPEFHFMRNGLNICKFFPPWTAVNCKTVPRSFLFRITTSHHL